MRRGTWVVAALTAAGVAVGAAACGGADARARVPIVEVEVRDATTIDLVLDTCVPHPGLQVAQTDAAVEVRVTPGRGGGCDQRVRVSLDAPLGDRAVVDARGAELPVLGRTRVAPIVEALVTDGGRALLLNVPTCQADTEVTSLIEGPRTVEVEISVTGGDGQLECLDPVEVRLAEPLGDRELIDASTGRPVPSLGYLDAGS